MTGDEIYRYAGVFTGFQIDPITCSDGQGSGLGYGEEVQTHRIGRRDADRDLPCPRPPERVLVTTLYRYIEHDH